MIERLYCNENLDASSNVKVYFTNSECNLRPVPSTQESELPPQTPQYPPDTSQLLTRRESSISQKRSIGTTTTKTGC